MLQFLPERTRNHAVRAVATTQREQLHRVDSMAAIHLLQRIGEVQDTSDAALFLATADFVTGTMLDVDGGYSHGR